MSKLYYQGHGSYRLTTNAGTVVYVDPFAGDGYDLPADLILVTHEHGDHNQVEKPARKPGCVVLRAADLLKDGVYEETKACGISIRAVEACNKNHPKDACVGYLLSFDGLKIYCAGDTDTTGMMKDVLPRENLDYALLPCDGYYNMDIREASACARMIGARHTIPIHSSPTGVADPWLLWDEKTASGLDCPGRLLVKNGEEITL